MEEYTAAEVATLIEAETQHSLDALLREGARRMLQAALEMEVEAYIERCKAQRDGSGQRLVVRNGHHRTRAMVTGSARLLFASPGFTTAALSTTSPARFCRPICGGRPR